MAFFFVFGLIIDLRPTFTFGTSVLHVLLTISPYLASLPSHSTTGQEYRRIPLMISPSTQKRMHILLDAPLLVRFLRRD
jgi:hypothetical protein